MAIERLTHLTPELLATAVAESEAHGLAFVARLTNEWINGVNRFDRPGEALFAVRDAADIVAVGGLNVDPYTTEPGTGRVRPLYVVAAHRRHGLGAALVSEIIAAARGHFHTLRLSTSNPDAARLYERLGFRPRADLAKCTHIMEAVMTQITTRSAARVQSIAPQFLVDALETALASYRDQLGFTAAFTYQSFYT